ncbi:MAG: hypothetical protein J5883_02500 [Clostridiales bacterium]|nr:hypothetical protein [Clostridiales bacterium]
MSGQRLTGIFVCIACIVMVIGLIIPYATITMDMGYGLGPETTTLTMIGSFRGIVCLGLGMATLLFTLFGNKPKSLLLAAINGLFAIYMIYNIVTGMSSLDLVNSTVSALAETYSVGAEATPMVTHSYGPGFVLYIIGSACMVIFGFMYLCSQDDY